MVDEIFFNGINFVKNCTQVSESIDSAQFFMIDYLVEKLFTRKIGNSVVTIYIKLHSGIFQNYNQEYSQKKVRHRVVRVKVTG